MAMNGDIQGKKEKENIATKLYLLRKILMEKSNFSNFALTT